MRRLVVTGGSGKAGRAVVQDPLTAPIRGADAFIIAAADTVMDRPDPELLAACFPEVPVREGAEGQRTLLSIEKARRVLGYDPAWSWRDVLGETAAAGRSVAVVG